jgi:fluoride ion exporter CrcB/FEX
MCGSTCQMNLWPVLVSGVAYWLIGSLWYSALFGKTWAKELTKLGIKIKEPKKKELISKILVTFFLNLLGAFAVAIVVKALQITTLPAAIALGLTLGVCFTATTLGVCYLWESRSWKLTLIDITYPILGILASSIILTLWR